LGLAHGLRAAGRRVAVWPLDRPPRRYAFLPGFDEFTLAGAPTFRAGDVLAALDCAARDRLPPPVAAYARKGGDVVNLDHHASNERFGAVAWVEPAAPATAALVWAVLREMATPLPFPAALALYVGLVTDTGGFSFSNANGWAFEVAADLVARGVRPAEVETDLYERYTLEHVRVLGAALAGMKRAAGGAVVYTSLPLGAMTRAGATGDETEGVVDYTRRVEGCRVGVLFRELPDGAVKVSFRAGVGEDILPLAVAHGGGGHPAAAGCRLEGSLAEVERLVIAEVEAWLRRR
jgi:phosphoesterase RecJ-like protein